MENIILPLHIASLLFALFNIVMADHMGFDWMRGKVSTLDAKKVAKYHKGSWIALLSLIGTGSLLFYPLREYLLAHPQFYIKMTFVFALIINGIAIGKLSKVATTKSFSSLSTKEKIPLLISGAVSTISWAGAAITALFLIPE